MNERQANQVMDALHELVTGAAEQHHNSGNGSTAPMGDKQHHMMMAHEAFEAVTRDHDITVNMLRSTAVVLRQRADEFDALADEVNSNIRKAAEAAVNSMKYERKAYAELQDVLRGLDNTIARIKP